MASPDGVIIGIVIFPAVEELDFTGPFEVFASLSRSSAWPRRIGLPSG